MYDINYGRGLIRAMSYGIGLCTPIRYCATTGLPLTRNVPADSFSPKSVWISSVSVLFFVLHLFDVKRGIYIGVRKAVISSPMSNKVAKRNALEVLNYRRVVN